MRRQFFKVLKKCLASRDIQLPSDSNKLIEKSAKALMKKNKENSYGAPERYHLELACLVFETYTYLKRCNLDSESLNSALMAAVTTPNSNFIQWGVRLKLFVANDPMSTPFT